MDSLRSGAGSNGDYHHHRTPECFPPRGLHLENLEEGEGKEGGHAHSNSDSGLSSLSGRTSCMSPLSVISTVSSASSGSSRASLRSASIVSSTTIPLEEYSKCTAAALEEFEEIPPGGGHNQGGWEEEQEINKLASELFKLMPVNANVSALFGESSFMSVLILELNNVLSCAQRTIIYCTHPLGFHSRLGAALLTIELRQKLPQRQARIRPAV